MSCLLNQKDNLNLGSHEGMSDSDGIYNKDVMYGLNIEVSEEEGMVHEARGNMQNCIVC